MDMIELSGRPAIQFTILVSDKQFQVTWNKDTGNELMALSSSLETYVKCMVSMLELGTGRKAAFHIEEDTDAKEHKVQ